MAALDFPASPVNGQVFAAPNGVTYIYSSTYTAWQAQPMSAGFVGDLHVYGPTNVPSWPNGGESIVIFGTVLTGNAGGWYNTTTGRLKLPKGRYFMAASISGYSSSAGIRMNAILRKNGVTVATSDTYSGATVPTTPIACGVFESNGTTDYFEVFEWSNPWPSAVTATGCYLSVIPVSPNANMVQGTGDFFAGVQTSGYPPSPATPTGLNVMSGNSGGWYNNVNGRYTPPAGRYLIWATIASGYSASATTVSCYLRKNGVNVIWATQVPGTANWTGDPSVQAIVDANGTDWFDIQGACNNGSNVTQWTWFGAFPISGIKGPQGDPGAVGQAGANAFSIRTTTNGFALGNNYTGLFRSEATPVIDLNTDGVINTTPATMCQFTAPNAGRYHLEVHAYLYHTTNGQGALIIRHTNSGGSLIRQYADVHYSDTTGYGSQFAVSIDLQMAAGDKIDWWYATFGACYPIPSGSVGGSGTSQMTWASGHRIN